MLGAGVQNNGITGLIFMKAVKIMQNNYIFILSLTFNLFAVSFILWQVNIRPNFLAWSCLFFS